MGVYFQFRAMATPHFGYWQCQGLGQPARMVLSYNAETHEDTVYEFQAKEESKTHWPTQKFNLGLPFPNLPYYIDGDVKLTQSDAILRHLGRKYKMYGFNDNDASEKLKEAATKDGEPKFKQLSEFLGTKKFIMGDSMTIADFPIYDALKWHLAMDKDFLDKFPNLSDFIKRFESNPKIKAFLSSDKAFTGIFSPEAHWGVA